MDKTWKENFVKEQNEIFTKAMMILSENLSLKEFDLFLSYLDSGSYDVFLDILYKKNIKLNPQNYKFIYGG